MMCCCPDWEPNIEKLNAPAVLQFARTGTGEYDGKPFVHCPWCGKRLLPTIKEMSGLVHDFTNGKSLKEYMKELSDESCGW